MAGIPLGGLLGARLGRNVPHLLVFWFHPTKVHLLWSASLPSLP
jgi:hypothetical protein